MHMINQRRNLDDLIPRALAGTARSFSVGLQAYRRSFPVELLVANTSVLADRLRLWR